MKRLGKYERALLAGCRRELARLRAAYESTPSGSSEWQDASRAWKNAQNVGLPYDSPRLVGRDLSRSEMELLRRATIRLEERGLLERVRYWGDRVTNLKLSDLGLTAAAELVSQEGT